MIFNPRTLLDLWDSLILLQVDLSKSLFSDEVRLYKWEFGDIKRAVNSCLVCLMILIIELIKYYTLEKIDGLDLSSSLR